MITALELVKKFLTYYKTRRLMTIFTWACH